VQVMKYAEYGGPFTGSTFDGRMPDSRHMVGMQSHANQIPLSHLCLVLTPEPFAQTLVEELNRLPDST
jgi:hypothetical protein